jgi:hypothetical protein
MKRLTLHRIASSLLVPSFGLTATVGKKSGVSGLRSTWVRNIVLCFVTLQNDMAEEHLKLVFLMLLAFSLLQ